jgi:hypothetical protein
LAINIICVKFVVSSTCTKNVSELTNIGKSRLNRQNSFLLKCFQNDNAHIYLFINVTKREFLYTIMGECVFFYKYWKYFTINTARIISTFFISLSKMHTSTPKKLIKFTRISRTVWTKKTEISQNTEKKKCVFTVTRSTLSIFTQNSDNHFCCLISSNVLFIQLLAFCQNWEQRR